MNTPDSITPQPDAEAEQPASAGCAEMPCSPSSDTPETTEILARIMDEDGEIDEYNSPKLWVDHGRKMERDKNAARTLHAYANEQRKVADNARMNAEETTDRLHAAIRNLRDVQGRFHTQQAVERLIALLPENASVEARQK